MIITWTRQYFSTQNYTLRTTTTEYGLTRANRIIKSTLHRGACYLSVICTVTRRNIPHQGSNWRSIVFFFKIFRPSRKQFESRKFSKHPSSSEFLSNYEYPVRRIRDEEVGSIEQCFMKQRAINCLLLDHS